MVDLSHMLQEAFKAHGLEPRKEGNWLFLDPCPSPIRASYRMNEEGTLCRMDIHIPFSDGRILEESFAGLGDSEEACVQQAFESFMLGSFHVLLRCVFQREGDSKVKPEDWSRPGLERQVYLGEVMVRGSKEERPELPANFLDTVKTLVVNQEMSHAFHWLRIFQTRAEGQVQHTEVLWDNLFWPKAAQAIEDLDWQLGEAHSSLRLFLILEHKGEWEPRTYYQRNEIEEAERLVETALHLPYYDQADSEAWTDLLLKMGFDEYEVFKAVNLIPRALGRELLKESDLSFEDSFSILDEQGNAVEHGRLSRDPIFRAASKVDFEEIGHQLFSLHALKSAEVDAVNQALEAGSCAEDLVFSGTVLMGAPVSSARPARSEPKSEPPKPHTSEKDDEKKPWWKFWG